MTEEQTPLTGISAHSATPESEDLDNKVDSATENCDYESVVDKQVVSETRREDKVDIVQSIDTDNVSQDLSAHRNLITEIKEFLKTVNPKLQLDQETRLKIFHLTRALQNINFDAHDIRTQTELKDQDLEAFKNFINYVEDKCEELDLDTINEPVQEEIAKLVVLLYRIQSLIYSQEQKPLRRKKLVVLTGYLEIALRSLFQTEPNIILAQNIRIEIQEFVSRCEHPIWGGNINRFKKVQRSKSTPLKVLYGLLTAFLVTIGVSAIIIIPLLFYLQFGTQTSKKIRTAEQERDKILIEIGNLAKPNNIKDDTNSNNRTTNNAYTNLETNSQKNSEIVAADVVGQKVSNDISVEWDDANRRLQSKEYQLTLLKQQRSADLRTIDTIIQITLVIVAGTLGSIISILTRIEDFQDRKYQDPLVPFLLGAFKPIIGAAFGIFFFTLLSSELLVIPSIQESPTNQLVLSPAQSPSDQSAISYQQLEADRAAKKKQFFIFAIAFVVGFSERIAKDAISKMEGTMGSNSENQQSQPSAIRVSQLRTSRQTTVQKEISQEHNSSQE